MTARDPMNASSEDAPGKDLRPARRHTARSTLLLMLVVLVIGVLGTWVLAPVGASSVLIGAAVVITGFVGVQWLVFNTLGLRSSADSSDDSDKASTSAEDARAWKG